jgi:hypothetical protein
LAEPFKLKAMFSILKKLFKAPKSEYYSLEQDLDFSKGIEFSKPDEKVMQKLEVCLLELQNKKGEFLIESPLKKRKIDQFSDASELARKIFNDVELNYSQYYKEFIDEPLLFKYVLGTEMLFKNSIEIIQKISHKEKTNMGDLYYSLVVKYKDGKYYYWPW